MANTSLCRCASESVSSKHALFKVASKAIATTQRLGGLYKQIITVSAQKFLSREIKQRKDILAIVFNRKKLGRGQEKSANRLLHSRGATSRAQLVKVKQCQHAMEDATRRCIILRPQIRCLRRDF